MLSMLLAAAMVCSLLCGVTVNAATDYKDDSLIANQEAVAVLSALGLFEGSDGSFNPNGQLTREQAAKLIAVLKLGKAAADKLTASGAPFSDVAADRWSAPYIAYCKQEGIIAGKNDGKFYPRDPVTGTQWAKMLVVALGYDADKSGLVGSDWADNVQSAAAILGICSSGTCSDKAITRDTAALYLFNAVTAPVVVYDKDGVPRKNAASNASGYLSGAVNDKLQQYCEKNFPELKKVYSEDGLTISWQYNGKTIYTAKSASTVKIDSGLVAGVATETPGVTVYKGIPFAAAPVGDLRWKAPQPVEPWDGVKVCDTFSAICPQADSAWGDFGPEFYSGRGNTDFYGVPEGEYPEMNEDCLYLNVWTPSKTGNEKLPVMVYVHGGGNGSGWSYEIEFDGEGFASRDVILVTINYRVGVFGFLSHPDLSAEADGSSGNYGLMDQVAALQWVQDNIAAFGGDPSRVTVFGQSAGAMDVTALVCSPMTKGLVSGAIMQSGGFGDTFVTGDGTSLADAEAKGLKMTEDLGKSIAELREMDAMELYTATANRGYASEMGFCIDGKFLTQATSKTMADGTYLDIDYMIGCNSNEMGGAFNSGNLNLGNLQLKHGRKPAYVYYFDYQIPGKSIIDQPDSPTAGAFHTGECWYIFETLERSWRYKEGAMPDYETADKPLAAAMADYWTNFGKTGNPNGKGLAEWVPYTERHEPTTMEGGFAVDLQPAIDSGNIKVLNDTTISAE